MITERLFARKESKILSRRKGARKELTRRFREQNRIVMREIRGRKRMR